MAGELAQGLTPALGLLILLQGKHVFIRNLDKPEEGISLVSLPLGDTAKVSLPRETAGTEKHKETENETQKTPV